MLSMSLHRLLLGFWFKMTDPGSMSYENMQQEGLNHLHHITPKDPWQLLSLP
jgi:hypothetical protein